LAQAIFFSNSCPRTNSKETLTRPVMVIEARHALCCALAFLASASTSVLVCADNADFSCDARNGKCQPETLEVNDVNRETDEAVFLQVSSVQTKLKSGSSRAQVTLGMGSKVRPALEYFRHWSAGKLTHAKKEDTGKFGTALLEPESWSTASMIELFDSQRSQDCPHLASLLQWEPHDSTIDDDGVHHVVVSSPNGLQYLAGRPGSLLVSDPPVCAERGRRNLIYLGRAVDDEADPNNDEVAGEEENANMDSELPKACLELAHQKAKEHCGHDFVIKPVWAHDEIINGVKVVIAAKFLTSPTKEAFHDIECDFQPPASKDAKLIQTDDEMTESDDIKGLIPTLRWVGSFCKADEESTLPTDEAEAAAVMLQFGFGDLSSTKGFEHVNDEIPMAADLLDVAPPNELDLRQQYSKCFPDGGKEVVRSQGNCGSCWAFAAASAAMNNLCISNNGASDVLATPGDRFEISVQQIMSCNNEKRGCNGGYAFLAHSAWQKNGGMHKERDVNYQCGGGNPLDHFADGGDCKTWPWGTPCSGNPPVAAWKPQNGNWLERVSGETNMVNQLVSGRSIFVTFFVFPNFMGAWWKAEVYRDKAGATKMVGGHAMTAVGYGTLHGVKFWHIQNSWGTRWANGGYARFLRGEDFCGIETDSFVPTVEVQSAGPEPQPSPEDDDDEEPTSAPNPTAAPTPTPDPGPAPTPPTTDKHPKTRWESFKSMDAYSGQNAEIWPRDSYKSLDEVKAHCSKMNYGGFTMWNGIVFFREQTAGQLSSAKSSAPDGTLYIGFDDDKDMI